MKNVQSSPLPDFPLDGIVLTQKRSPVNFFQLDLVFIFLQVRFPQRVFKMMRQHSASTFKFSAGVEPDKSISSCLQLSHFRLPRPFPQFKFCGGLSGNESHK